MKITRAHHKIGWLFIFCLSISKLSAQDIPIHDFWNREIEKTSIRNPSLTATSYKPMLQSETDFTQFPSQIKDSAKYYWNINRILFRDHWIEYKKEDVEITVDPWVDLSVYKDKENESYNQKIGRPFNNSRGAWIKGKIGSGFSFHTAFLETQSLFPFYMHTLADSLQVIPGMGRFKAFEKYGYDYAISSSSINIEPSSFIHVSLNYGRQMIGNGYRSVLLSDAVMNYPFVNFRLTKKKWVYISSAGLMQEQERIPLGATSESLYKRKINSWNYFIFIPHPSIEIGILESVSYSIWNPTGRQSPHYSLYMPVIGMRTLLDDNSKTQRLYGLNFKLNVAKKFITYGQWAFQNEILDRNAYQFGVLYSNFIIDNLDIRAEFNFTSPYFYSSGLNLLSYSQQNQSLGHPAGGNMKEWLLRLDYRKKRFLFHGDINQINQITGLSSMTSTLQYTDMEESTRDLLQWQTQVGWVINPKSNFSAWVGYTKRKDIHKYETLASPVRNNASLFTISLSSTFHSRYFDF